MRKMLEYRDLAREDRLVLMPARRIGELRAEQGLLRFPVPVPSASEDYKSRLHGILVGEMEAMEGAGRTVYDFDQSQVPWEFTLDMARQVWDESRHVEIYEKLMGHVDGYLGEYPESLVLWRCACASDPAARVAGINRGLEGLACDVFAQLIDLAQKYDDPTIAGAVGFVLADEITHVRMGTRWMRKLTEGDPERLQAALDFQHNIDERFTRATNRQQGAADEVTTMIASEARKEAGFSDDEIADLIRTSQRSIMY